MAKIQMGGVAAQVRGSIGNTTFSRNRGGAYIRARVSGVQPRTTAQTTVRANFGNNSKAWSGTLTDAQRAAWVAFAASNPVTDIFGASITLNGVAMFVRLNQVLKQIGEPTISDPPASYTVDPGPNAVNVSATTPDQVTVNVDDGSVPEGTEYYIFAAPPTAPGRSATSSQFRWLQTATFVSSVSNTIALGEAYVAKFGNFVDGQNIAVLIGQVNTATGAVLPGIRLDAPAHSV